MMQVEAQNISLTILYLKFVALSVTVRYVLVMHVSPKLGTVGVVMETLSSGVVHEIEWTLRAGGALDAAFGRALRYLATSAQKPQQVAMVWAVRVTPWARWGRGAAWVRLHVNV